MFQLALIGLLEKKIFVIIIYSVRNLNLLKAIAELLNIMEKGLGQ